MHTLQRAELLTNWRRQPCTCRRHQCLLVPPRSPKIQNSNIKNLMPAHLELGGQQLEDVIDLVLETAREHLIGLVQGEHLDAVGAQVPGQGGAA